MTEGALERGRRAAEDSNWADAHAAFAVADDDLELGAEDLEVFAESACLLGQVDVCIDALQRAHHQFLERGEPRRAIRCGFWVGFNFFNQGDFAQGGAWLARVHRLCQELGEDCAEHGLPLIGVAYQQIRVQGDYPGGEATARRALDLGKRFVDPDVVGLAQVLLGGSLIRQEKSEEGLAVLDETMIGVLAGKMSPVVAGTIYCAMIKDCEEIFDYRRVREWTEALTRWSERQKGMLTFAGECRVHRATIYQYVGTWKEAQEEVALAASLAPLGADRYVIGLASYRRAELHRLRGEFKAAEDDYQRCSEWGIDPYPGLSLMRLGQGNTAAAASSIKRALGELPERSRRAALLPAMVHIMIAVGDIDSAEKAVTELTEIAAVFETPGLEAEAAQVRGALLLAEAEHSEAMTPLRKAQHLWMSLGFPYNEARVRVLIAEACSALGDVETANSELDVARGIFSRLGATPDLRHLGATETSSHGLTSRELEVLRLIAAGKTNQMIADELFLSVKTVDRHASNIFTKIGVSSRSAATAYAFNHQLV